MHTNKDEVIVIRRLMTLIFLLLLLIAVSSEAQAATMQSKAGAVTTAAGNLNVRAQPSSASAVVASVKKGSYLTLISKSGAWWKVEYAKGTYGYCHSDYVTVVEGTPVTVSTQSGSLNVRTGAAADSPVAAKLSKGETVLFLSHKNGWSRVLYHGTKTGYVSARYLSNYRAPVSLSVPSYKQTDARWANKQIGASGKTFAQIGCATTAIAMMESFRTGTTIYPDAMAKQLRYTASGNVYWPANFTPVTGSAGYLTAIYQKLKQGKPVMLGATNSYGSQHWVVITGFRGGVGVQPLDFTILDPGSHSRTNLQQFLTAYPNFYKYFYY